MRAEAFAYILIGLSSLQVAKSLLLESSIWAAECLIWIMVAIAISLIQPVRTKQFTIVSLLLVAAGVCVPLGRFAGEAYSLGSISLFISDIFGASALIILGGSVLVDLCRDIISRIRGAGLGYRGSILDSHISGGDKK